MDSEILKWLDTARIDIKNQGEGNDVKVAIVEGESCNISRPRWFAKGGIGYVVETCDKHLVLELECTGAGILILYLRGLDRYSSHGERFPLYVDYTNLIVNRENIFQEIKALWHDKPYKFSKQVADKEKVYVEISWKIHGYKGIELDNLLSKYNPYYNLYENPANKLHYYEETDYKDVDDDVEFLLWRRYEKPYMDVLKDVVILDDVQQKKWVNNLRNFSRLDMCRLVVVLGTKCTLNCRDCNNLMPYFKPQKDTPIETIMYSLKHVLNLADSIIRVELIGGEPFVSNNLKPVLSLLLQQKHVMQVELTTNATVFPKVELITLLQNEKVIVRVSDYGKHSRTEEVVNFMNNHDIRYKVLNLRKWTSADGYMARNHSLQTLKKGYFHCGPGYECTTLYEGKLYACARSASLHGLGAMEEREELMINAATTKEAIRGFLIKPYSLACDHCDKVQGKQQVVPPAVQL